MLHCTLCSPVGMLRWKENKTNNNTGRAPQNPEQVLVKKVGKDLHAGRGQRADTC